MILLVNVTKKHVEKINTSSTFSWCVIFLFIFYYADVTYYDFELTFSDTYSVDLSDVSSTYYSLYVAKVQLALESLLGSMQVASDCSVVWTFSSGSTIASASNVPVLYVTDTTDFDEELNSNLQAGSIENLMTATAKSKIIITVSAFYSESRTVKWHLNEKSIEIRFIKSSA